MKNFKERIAAITSILAFIIGFGLTIAGFIVPPVGEVSGSVLWVLGLCLLYCGAILGISNHYDNRLQSFEAEIRLKLDK